MSRPILDMSLTLVYLYPALRYWAKYNGDGIIYGEIDSSRHNQFPSPTYTKSYNVFFVLFCFSIFKLQYSFDSPPFSCSFTVSQIKPSTKTSPCQQSKTAVDYGYCAAQCNQHVSHPTPFCLLSRVMFYLCFFVCLCVWLVKYLWIKLANFHEILRTEKE